MAPVPPVHLDPPQPVQVAVMGILGAVWVDEMAEEDVIPEGQAERPGHGRVVGEAGKAEWRKVGLGAGHDWFNSRIHKKGRMVVIPKDAWVGQADLNEEERI